jgi:signal peptidase I
MFGSFKKMYAWYNRPKSAFLSWVEFLVVFLPIVFIVRTWLYGLYVVPSGSMETTMLVGEGFFADKLTIIFKKPQHGDIISFNEPTFPYSKNKAINLFQRYMWGPKNLTKRVIGCPGDTIKMTVEDGVPVVYRNGKKLDEPYLNKYPIIAVYNPYIADTFSYRSFDPSKPLDQQQLYHLDNALVRSGERYAEQYGWEKVRNPGTVHWDYNRFGQKYIYDEQEIQLGPDEYWVMGDNRRGSADSRYFGKVKEHLIHGYIRYRLWSFDTQGSGLLSYLLLHPIKFFTGARWSRFLQPVR